MSTQPLETDLPAPLFWLPLVAALLFSLGALLMKRSVHPKLDIWRTTFVSNLTTALAFLPLLALGGQIPGWQAFWQPLVVAGLFVVGQVATVVALTRGEVSVAAPVLGLKIVLVAFFSRLIFGRPLPGDIWLASSLATAGVMLLNLGARPGSRQGITLSLACGGLAAVAFGLFDVCVQLWSPRWGVGRFLPIMLITAAVLSCGFIARFQAPLWQIPAASRPWLAGGSLLIALQSLTFVTTLAVWGQAAAANVLYSTRGLWSVLLVGWLGPWIGVRDAGLDRRTAGFRLAGAALLLLAIAILAR
jgi:drug/metabolite transporter (DMT)-like permease